MAGVVLTRLRYHLRTAVRCYCHGERRRAFLPQ
jgi:hypothetical protein